MAKKPSIVETMIRLYCRANCDARADNESLCSDCQKLLDYAVERLEKCPQKSTRTSCGRCSTPCYREPYKSQIRSVMKYAGPRMAFKHPIKTVKYVLDHI